MLTTTFAALREEEACDGRYRHLVKALGGIRAYGKETPIPIALILQHNGLDDTIWALDCCNFGEQRTLRDRLVRTWLCDCAEHVLPVWEAFAPEDMRPRACIAGVRQYLAGEITAQKMQSLAVDAADAAWTDTASVAWGAAADVAVFAAAGATRAVAARHATADAGARAAERAWQAERLRELLEAEGCDL